MTKEKLVGINKLLQKVKQGSLAGEGNSFFFKNIRLILYLIVGGITAVINWGIMAGHQFLMTRFQAEDFVIGKLLEFVVIARPYHLSAFWGYTISALINYYWNDKYVFDNVETNHKKRIPKFFLVSLTGLFVNLSLTTVFIEKFGVSPYFVTPIVIILGLIWNYIGHKLITFSK